MADVFISYAKADRPLALKLAAMLEAEGWKTWWDTSLTIRDDFRNEIMTELGRARAVIVIWTDASIKSDWVRSEAGRAQADRKLIPVKLPHLVYEDLPPPFDVLHTEDVGQEDKIKAAVVAQLAKPAVEPSSIALLTKGFRYELLTWFGIVGGALTLFGNLDAVLKLADWARVLVQQWKGWTHAFWVWVFGWLGIHLAPYWTPVLSFLLFGALLAIGQAFKFNRTTKDQFVDRYDYRSFQLASWRTFVCIILLIASLAPVIVGVVDYAFTNGAILSWEKARFSSDVILFANFIAIFITPPLIIVLFAKHRTYAALSVVLMVMFYAIIVATQFRNLNTTIYDDDTGVAAGFTGFTMLWILPLILLIVAPAKAISRRLIFLALGLLLLIALNELSKLGLDVTAPKLQG